MTEIIIQYWWLISLAIAGIILGIASTLRTVVPPNKIDIVIRNKKSGIYCSNAEYFVPPKKDEKGRLITPSHEDLKGVEIKNVYYHIPQWVPMFGMYVRRLPLEMLSIKVPNFVAFDSNRARFECDIVAFCAITDGVTASMRIPPSQDGGMGKLQEQVQQVLWATMRDSTTKMIVRDIINNRKEIIDMIRDPLREALDEWGLALKDIEIIEFKDAPEGKVITNLSSIREQEIDTEAREKNAEQVKKARLAEAEADEKATMREVEKAESVAKREQDMKQKVAIQEKLAKEKELDVKQVELVKTQKIEKEQAEVLARQQKEVARIEAEKMKEVEKIIKEQKKLEGEGDRQRDEEKAKGEAAFALQKGKAEAQVIEAKLLGEAKGKEELQKALNKFKENAILAMTALRAIEKDETIYTEFAKSMGNADTKLFMGGDKSGKGGFDFGQSMEGLLTASGATGLATLNKLGQPNDLGFQDKNWIKLALALQQNPQLKKNLQKEIKKVKDDPQPEEVDTEEVQKDLFDDFKED